MTRRVRVLALALLGLLAAGAPAFGTGPTDGQSPPGALQAGGLMAATLPLLADHAALRSEPEIIRALGTQHRPVKLRLVAAPAAVGGPASAPARRDMVEERSALRPGLAGRSLLAAGRAPPTSRLA